MNKIDHFHRKEFALLNAIRALPFEKSSYVELRDLYLSCQHLLPLKDKINAIARVIMYLNHPTKADYWLELGLFFLDYKVDSERTLEFLYKAESMNESLNNDSDFLCALAMAESQEGYYNRAKDSFNKGFRVGFSKGRQYYHYAQFVLHNNRDDSLVKSLLFKALNYDDYWYENLQLLSCFLQSRGESNELLGAYQHLLKGGIEELGALKDIYCILKSNLEFAESSVKFLSHYHSLCLDDGYMGLLYILQLSQTNKQKAMEVTRGLLSNAPHLAYPYVAYAYLKARYFSQFESAEGKLLGAIETSGFLEYAPIAIFFIAFYQQGFKKATADVMAFMEGMQSESLAYYHLAKFIVDTEFKRGYHFALELLRVAIQQQNHSDYHYLMLEVMESLNLIHNQEFNELLEQLYIKALNAEYYGYGFHRLLDRLIYKGHLRAVEFKSELVFKLNQDSVGLFEESTQIELLEVS